MRITSALLFITSLLLAKVSMANLSTSIQSLLTKKLPHTSTGIVIMSAYSGKVRYSYHAKHDYIPASNTKLFTAAAALETLGSSYRFQTWLGAKKSKIKPHQIDGNLYIYFSGDPSLRQYQLKNLIKQLRQKGITHIHGNIVLRSGKHAENTYPIGEMLSDTLMCYGAMASTINLSQNCFVLKIESINNKAKASSSSSYVRLKNHLLLASENQLKSCVFQPTMSQNNLLTINGCLPNRKEWQLRMAIANPGELAKQIIAKQLRHEGIRYHRITFAPRIPNGLTRIAIHRSAKLSALLKYMLQESDNLYANAITKAIGKQTTGIASIKAGVNRIEALLRPKIKGTLTLEDGAGLSYYNHTSPIAIANLLHEIYRNKSLKTTLINSLPQSGISGTLSYRMNSKKLLGHVYAKTGSMTGISSLSGYLVRQHKPTMIFSIINNGVHGSLRKARRTQDQIVKLIAHYF